MTYAFNIGKINYDMSGIIFENKTVEYDGESHSLVISGTLPTGIDGKTVTVSYLGNATNVSEGAVTITAVFGTESTNYNVPSEKTATITITKATNEWTEELLIDGWTYADTANNPSATANLGEVVYTYSTEENGTYNATKPTNAGTYYVKAEVVGTDNYTSLSATKSFVINKATYDMSGIKFANKTVVENGAIQAIKITGELPQGVSVSYENNENINPGVYTITAKFSGDTVNYNTISSMQAVLTINKTQMISDNNPQKEEETVVIESENGLNPNLELVVEVVETAVQNKYDSYLEKKEEVAAAYDVTMLLDGVKVQPNGEIIIKILIPTQLIGKEFRILHVHSETDVSEMEYQIEGDYVLFKTNKLSEFVFIEKVETQSLLWLIILLLIIAVLQTMTLILQTNIKNKKNTEVKTMSFIPFIILAIPVWQIALLTILIIVNVVLFLAIILRLFVTNKNNQNEEEIE